VIRGDQAEIVCKENTGKKVGWPFTDGINFVGTLMRFVRTALIVLGGVFLIVGAVLK
jgi:hypothetical protein